MTDTVRYCYAVIRPPHTPLPAGLLGVNSAAVDLIEFGDLVAVTSEVPATEFDGHTVGVDDLSWLEHLARKHNEIVDAAVRCATALPFRLATVYLDEQSVVAMLTERSAELGAALDRVAGCAEWGVKVYAGTSKPETPESQPQPEDDRSGRAYLRRRRDERDAGERAREAAAAAAERVDSEVSAIAVDRRLHRPQSPELSGERAPNVLNAAYLIPTERTEELRASLARLRAEAAGVRVELTGPWAPYSFAVPQVVQRS